MIIEDGVGTSITTPSEESAAAIRELNLVEYHGTPVTIKSTSVAGMVENRVVNLLLSPIIAASTARGISAGYGIAGLAFCMDK